MFLVNVDWFFMSHRLPIALEAMRQGYEVHIATGITDQRQAMQDLGLEVHPISIDRSSTSILKTIRTLWQVLMLFRKVKPDIVHLVTIKPVLLGGLAARLTGIKSMVAAISGLGYVFLDRGWQSRVRRRVVAALYRMALGHHNIKIIFQNPDDRDCLAKLTGIPPSVVEMIRGSGVDLQLFRHSELPGSTPVVLFAARLLADKGVREFVEAARLLHSKGIPARFCLAGSPDPENPSSVTDMELFSWQQEGVVEWWGYRKDVATVLTQARIVVLPSYREGVPKVLLEAAACGRAVITTDVPGCRDAIEPNVTGILVPVRDAHSLAYAIQSLLENPTLCKEMGVAGRHLAEQEFDVGQVVSKHMQIYHQLATTA